MFPISLLFQKYLPKAFMKDEAFHLALLAQALRGSKYARKLFEKSMQVRLISITAKI
jgi:hypothetical protein